MAKYFAVIAPVLTAATLAAAVTSVNEDFEGSFPPTGWTVETSGTGSGRWAQATTGGLWGSYAWGSERVVEGESGSATLTSHEFNVAANVTLYFRFDYKCMDYAYASGNGYFFLKYVNPPNELFSITLNKTAGWWEEYSGNKQVTRAGTVVAGWRVWSSCGWRSGATYLSVDRVIVSDFETAPAVEPTSLGRVKALYR